MRRREFIALLGGTVATWPLTAPRSRILPGASILNPSKLAGSEENLRGLGYERGSGSQSSRLPSLDLPCAAGTKATANRFNALITAGISLTPADYEKLQIS